MSYVTKHGRQIQVEILQSDRKPVRAHRDETFAQIPLNQLKRFSRAMPEVTVVVYLFYLAWRTKGRTFALPNRWLADAGITRWTKYRVLIRLERAGLIRVDQQPRKTPTITLLR